MPLPFNKNLDLKLLELVKENPILYNTKHSKYLDFDSREVVWQKIGDTLNRPAVEFAGIQCQIHYEDFQEDKHKPGFIENLNEFLPVTYSGSWGIEKKVLRAYRKHTGLSPLEAKNLYIKTARALPTYGVTFFLVKEKQKGKKKLVPRLLGINAEAILRMDEVTKEILQQWPLTHVKNYHVGKAETFTLNFGDYSDKEYCCKTQDVHRIRDILEGYIDLIRRRMLAKPSGDIGDSMAICHDMVEVGQSNVIQHVHNQASKLVSETFVGPSRIIAHDQGSTPQQGTQVMTMQQIIASNQFNNPQKAIRGEVAQRGDMSLDCVRKLKRMNSCSVKVVTLLAEPTEANISDTQQLTKNMQDDLAVVEMGVQAIAQQQTIEESRQMLLNEMQDLNNYMNKLSDAVKPGQVDPNEAKDAAEKIVDLTTEMYLAQDPRTKRRSEILNRSKKSFIAGEKMDESIRRASFLTAASSTIGALDRAAAILDEEYVGSSPGSARARLCELALQRRLAQLSAALALCLTAHSDPNNIDYNAAINSMNTIDELLPELAKEGQLLASTKTPEDRKELLDDLRALIDNTRHLCSLTGVDDHAKMQEASSKYADVAGKLIFKISRGGNSEKENEIIELAKVAGDKTTVLLLSANELTAQAPAEPGAALDAAGARGAAAAMDLLACAQLTAPAIYEPHCRSALTAAVEGLSSAVHQLSAAWRPLAEEPGRRQLGEQLHHREMDVHLALDKLKVAYDNLGDLEDESLPLEERQRLKFILSLAGAKDNLKGLSSTWGKSGAESPTVEGPPGSVGPKGVMMLELKEKAAARRLAQQLAELNGAVARLANATADPKQQDYVTAASALNSIAELMPTVVQDADVVSLRQDEGTRVAMKQQVTKLCEASQHLVDNLGSLDDLGPPAAKFSGACSKLIFLISPEADKGKEMTINELAAGAYDSSAVLLAQAHRLADRRGAGADSLRDHAARAELAARALVTVAQVTAPSVNEASCSSALASAVQHLQNCTNAVTADCYPHLKPGSEECEELQKSHKKLENNLEKLAQVCALDLRDQDIEMAESSDLEAALSPQREKRRMQFIKSMSEAKTRLDEAEQQMKEPLACVMMRAEDAAGLQRQLAERLARLNAAVATLARALADRENPDYEAAQRAVDTITELMPELVQETCVLGATRSGDTQRHVQRQLERLCRATQALCQAGDLTEATAEFADASGNLVSFVSPGADHSKENEIKALTSDACGRASELLSHVQDLIQKVPEEQGAELDQRGARTTDDAQALLTTAQVTAPTIASPHCSAALVSAAEQLRASAKDLTGACQPHLNAGQQEQQVLQNSAQQLESSLDKLVQACKEAPRRKPPPPPQQDKQRLHFVNSLSGAKSCFDDAQQLLNKPVVCAMMREEDGVALEHRLANRLAQLNAAIAALTAATADREHPDYASAQRAVSTITALMPELVRESRTLCGTRTGEAQESMLQQVQQLCDASRAVCDSAQQPQALGEAAAKFSDASGKLMFTLTPARGQGPEQYLELHASSEIPRRKPPPPPQQDKQRLHFVNSLSGAKTCFDDAQQLLKQPVVCAMMREEDGVALEHRLADRLAQLNAAIAALTAATADREHPDYASAERAINTITTLMPELVRDSKTLCGTRTEDAQQNLMRQVQQLCDASRAVCDSALQPQDLQKAANKFSDASGKLMFTLSPAPIQGKEKQIMDLSAQSCNRAAELLSQVQALQNQLRPDVAGHLDSCSRRTGDAAQALQAVAQVTASSMSSPACQAELDSAVQKLRGSAAELTAACNPHVKQGPQLQQLLETQQHLDDSLDMLLQASGIPVVLSPEQQEKNRLTFINSLSGAKSCFGDVEKQLKQPVVSITLQPEEQRALRRRLSDRLAQLNAAIAKLAAATADREHPDYASAQRAVSTITALMPELVRDAKTLTATEQGPVQQSMLQQVQQLCDASRAVCDSALQPQGLSDAAVKFSEASSQFTSKVAPGVSQGTQQQIIDLSAASVGLASELLSEVQALTQQIEGPAAIDLDRRGAKTADAAQALLSVAQVSAPSISSPQCKAVLESAVQKLRASATDLTSACNPHMTQGPQRQQMLDTHQKLNEALDTLLEASGVPVVLSPEQQEKRRLTFINSLSGAKSCFADVQQQLKQPVAPSTLYQEETRSLQRQLGDRLARLNAAVARLAAATADRDHPDYASAQRAVTTITALMPELVRDVKALSATQQGPAQQSLLRQVQQLCDASRAVCDSAIQPQGLSEAALKFSEASNELTSSVTPAGATLVKGGRQERQQQIVDLSAKSCVRASELLGQVQALTQQIDGPAATDLDRRGAKTADAAQALLSVAQVTAPSIRSPHCRKALESAVQRLRGSAADLTAACDPHVKQAQRQQLLESQQHLDDSLDLLLQASGARLSPELQEKQRQNFISDLAAAKSCFADVQQQLQQPMISSTLQPEEQRALQFRLADKLAQLNAALATLTVATTDREHPDYASAHRAVNTIVKLMPELVRDTKTLGASQQGPAQQNLMRQVQQLCDASRAVCDSALQPQDLSKVGSQFLEASSHLMSAVSPVDDHGKEKLLMDLSEASCSRASELVSQVQSKRGQLRADVTAQLDLCSTRTDDAAQALKTVVQMSASSMSSPECQAALESAVQALRDSASELAGTCDPHLDSACERQQVLDAHRHLDDSLDLLLQASVPGDRRSPALQEALRTKFIRCVSAISPQVKEAEKLLNQPLSCPPTAQAPSAALQHQLGRRLGHLNAALAALAAATADHKYPDYAAAERSIITITELMPKVVQESKTLSCTKSDDSQQKIRQHLKELCDASRLIVDNADDPKMLNEASAKFAFASGKLMQLVVPGDGDEGKRKGPAVPQRAAPKPDGHSKKTVTHGVPSRNSTISQDFLDAMRVQEDNEKVARVVAAEKKSDEEKSRRRQFSDTVDTVEDEIKYVEDIIKKVGSGACGVSGAELVRVERRAEEALARAGVDVAALVAANYADKLDYSAAQEPTLGLGRTLRAIVEDGCTISKALPEESQKPFINDMSGLCGATRILCQAARDEKERLNDAAIAFGNHSARLLQVVSAHVNPALEKEVIQRARAIGDSASRLALEATNVANNSANMQDGTSGEHVQSICTAGAQCVDAAGKLVYTAKLVAPTIHHKVCQEALTSSADTLSSNLKTFSDTWRPFASDPHTQKLTEESRKLARLLATLKADVERGRLGKTREVDRPVVVDTPLRQMTVQIIDNARNMAEHGDLPQDVKDQYRSYCGKLTEALRALDYANARCQRAPHDKNRRNEMEIAIQDLQMMLLQARPARAGQEQNNIVDFRDFLQGLVTEADNLASTVDKTKASTGKRTAEDIKLLCTKISEDSTKLMNPSQSAAYDGFDDIIEIDEFGQECDVLVRELNSLIRSVPEQKTRSELLARLFPLTENCSLLRFASGSALATAQAAAHDAALQDLADYRAAFLRALTRHRAGGREVPTGRVGVERAQSRVVGAGAWSCVRASLALCAAAARPQALRRALSAYALHQPIVATKASETRGELIQNNLNQMAQGLTSFTYFMETADNSRVEKTTQEKSLTDGDVGQLLTCSQEVEDFSNESGELSVMKHLEAMAREAQEATEVSALLAANWLQPDRAATTNLIKKVSWNIQELNKDPNADTSKPIEVLKEEDIEKLLSCQSPKVEGTRSQLEDKLSRLSTKLRSMGGSVFQSVRAPASAARSLHATASAAVELAAAARALRDHQKPAQSKRIEDAVHEMCLATFSLMKISEHLCQYPDHHDTRRRLLDACYHLNDSINKLNRTIHPEPSISRECNELLGALQLQRSALQSAAQPAASSPYEHCIEALQSQRDVLLKLNSDEAMSREEFLKSMLYVTSAVTNSTECAAQAAYLLSVSEKDTTVALEGLVDVPKMQKIISAIHDTCVSVTMSQIDQVIEEKRILEKQVEELLKDLDESLEKTKDQKLKTTLVMCRKEVEGSAKSFYKVVNEKKPLDVIISAVLALDDDIQQLDGALEHPALVPTGPPSPANQALCDDVLKHSTALVTDTQELIKDIKSSSEQSEVMKWSSFAKRKEVLSAIDALIKSIKTNGQNVKILEADLDESEQKSYVQIQTDIAFKWLHKPMAKSDVKTNGQQAVKNLIELGKKMTAELSGADKEDLRHAVDETEQLLAHCCRKYDQDQYSLLMERIRELQKAIERMAVTRVVEDFMDAEEPLADLDILADAERDETRRKFLLEQKIAELLAQLGRVSRTAAFVAHTAGRGAQGSSELRTCSEQTELLAPLLVKAAEERIHKSDNQMVIDNYRALLAQYTEALSKVRDLCDQSVDPMDFVQTAGETMQRMRDESINQDVMKCAYTSAAITKLANRVIHVGLSSSGARADPELQRALVGAQRQLSAATPAPDTRASKMPDWKDTTALILRATGEVESVLGGENIFNKKPDTDEPIYNEALNLHVAIRDWSSRDNEIVAVARRMAVLMAKLSAYMHADKQRSVLATSKSIVQESREVARLARKLAHECPDQRIRSNLLQVCDRIPTISGQLKMLTTIKGSSLGHHGTQEDKEAMDMLVGNAQSLMISIQDVVKAAASASVKIMSQRGPRIKWVRRTYY